MFIRQPRLVMSGGSVAIVVYPNHSGMWTQITFPPLPSPSPSPSPSRLSAVEMPSRVSTQKIMDFCTDEGPPQSQHYPH